MPETRLFRLGPMSAAPTGTAARSDPLSWTSHRMRSPISWSSPDAGGDSRGSFRSASSKPHLPGEEEIPRGEHVHATDGDIGQVEGVTVDSGTGRVTSVLLREGHLWGRRAVLIPREAVAEVDADGFHLTITRQQVRDLPPADTTS